MNPYQTHKRIGLHAKGVITTPLNMHVYVPDRDLVEQWSHVVNTSLKNWLIL